MPFSAEKLKEILALKNVGWEDAGKEIIESNHKINKATYLFEKIEDEKIAEQREKLRR